MGEEKDGWVGQKRKWNEEQVEKKVTEMEKKDVYKEILALEKKKKRKKKWDTRQRNKEKHVQKVFLKN